jgi:hypothetical protein
MLALPFETWKCEKPCIEVKIIIKHQCQFRDINQIAREFSDMQNIN